MSINSIFAGSTPHSRDTIRQQYLNNLALDIANMTKNLNANKLFKANGTTGSAPPDTRSATEKFADIEGLRQMVKTGLREITEPIEAENIVAEITTPELEYLAQNLPFIIRDLKPKFALGVPAGSFVPYLRRMLRSNIENEGLAYGLTTAPNVAGGVATTGAEYMTAEEVDYKLQEALNDDSNFVEKQSFTGNEREKTIFSALMSKMTSMAEMTPTHADRDMVASLRDPDILDNYDEIVAQIGQKLPFLRDLERALQLPTLAQKNKMLSGLLDGVNLAQLREFQEYLGGVRDELYQQEVEAKRQSLLEQRDRESPEDFEERIARENPVGAIPALQVPEGGDYTSPQSEALDILSRTPRSVGPQRQVATEQDSPDLPSSYIGDPNRDLGYTDLVAPNKGKALPYDDYSQLHYYAKKDMLLAYADAGIFDDMDAGFNQLINAIADGYDVPERAMDNEYRKFDKANSLFKTEGKDFGERRRVEYSDLNALTPYDERSQMGAEDADAPREIFINLMELGEFNQYPDFLDVAGEIYKDVMGVSEEDINNFLGAFQNRQEQEQEEMGRQDVNVARAPAQKAVKAKKSKLSVSPLFEEEIDTSTPPLEIEIPRKAEKASATPFKPPAVDISPATRLAELDKFKALSTPQKKGMLESLRDNRQIDDIKLIRRVNELRDAPQSRTLDNLYDDILISRGEVQSLASLPVSSAKAEKEAPPSPKGVASLKSGKTAEELGSVAGTTGSAEKAVPVPPYPTSVSAFHKVQGGNDTKRAIIEKAFHDQILDSDAIYDGDDLIAEISDETIALFATLFPPTYRGGDFIPESTTGAVLKKAYEGIFNILKYRKLLGTGLGLGMPVPHHVLGTNGYGLPHTLTAQRPMMQTMGGSLHHTKSAPMGEWGSGLPKNKKKGNIIFGMGLARPTQPSPRMGKNVNLAGGIEAEPSYVKFGTHLINKHRLKDNVVMMRTMKGGAIVNIPTQKVSGKLAKVLHCISGGGIPQFESVMDLADEDKALLHRITKTSKVSDRLSVPNPNKTKLEEEDNRFNILRGEVSIGNDAPAVIKEFKVLLLKFMREGRVPTGQGKAIMEELLLMGY